MILSFGGWSYRVTYTDDPALITRKLKEAKPLWITYDTETTGLHLKKDVPFLGAVCWTTSTDRQQGEVFVFPTNTFVLRELPKWASSVERVYAHNTTFDMHMSANIIGDEPVLSIQNWGDTQGLCRLIFEAVSARDGGDTLKLKDISKKYIDPNADKYEKAVKSWLQAKNRATNKILTALIRGAGYTRKEFDALQKADELTEELYDIYKTWDKEYPKATYQDVPMEIMLPYVASDVIFTDILVHKALPVVYNRKQDGIMEMEFELLRVVYKMERAGIEVDRDYLMESNERLAQYVKSLRQKMYALAGREFSVGQHQVIKEIYTERLGYMPKSTDKAFLSQQAATGDELAKTISRLRRLEKWKQVYIERILEVSEHDGYFYSQCGQFNPVSGRFSGDAQQFPKDKIEDDEGNHVFYPRRAFKMRGYYLDYSQVELRYQAHHTLVLFGGDLNLCRAYMPFQCVHYQTGELYSYGTFENRWRWNELRPGAPANKHWEDQLKEGWSAWVVPETGKPWVPTDVHSATSLRALAIMGLDITQMTADELKKWRDIGKRFNFMRKMLAHVKSLELLETLTA